MATDPDEFQQKSSKISKQLPFRASMPDQKK